MVTVAFWNIETNQETSETNLMDSGDFKVAAATAAQWSHVMPWLPLAPSIVVSSPLLSSCLTIIFIVTDLIWSPKLSDHYISPPPPFEVCNTLCIPSLGFSLLSSVLTNIFISNQTTTGHNCDHNWSWLMMIIISGEQKIVCCLSFFNHSNQPIGCWQNISTSTFHSISFN